MQLRFGTLLVAWLIAMVLWGMAHGTSSIERGVDIPIVFSGISEELVLTGKSADVVNIRVLGSRSSLRDVGPSKLEYRIDVDGSQPGPAVYEVDVTRIDLPRGARIVSRSPASIEVEFEQRGRKAVRVRPDLEGTPPEGFTIASVDVEPRSIWLTGARGDVLRLTEVVTEAIDVSGATEPIEREVRLSLGGEHVWRENDDPVRVRVAVVPVPRPLPLEEEGRPADEEGAERGGP